VEVIAAAREDEQKMKGRPRGRKSKEKEWGQSWWKGPEGIKMMESVCCRKRWS
jgi:hypothetical protein